MRERLILIPLLASLIIVPFMVVNPTEDGFVLSKVVTFQLLTITAFLLWVFLGKFKPIPRMLFLPFIAWVLVTGFSMFTSIEPWYSYREFFKLLSFLIFFYLISAMP